MILIKELKESISAPIVKQRESFSIEQEAKKDV
jgi:hypothetical protein